MADQSPPAPAGGQLQLVQNCGACPPCPACPALPACPPVVCPDTPPCIEEDVVIPELPQQSPANNSVDLIPGLGGRAEAFPPPPAGDTQICCFCPACPEPQVCGPAPCPGAQPCRVLAPGPTSGGGTGGTGAEAIILALVGLFLSVVAVLSYFKGWWRSPCRPRRRHGRRRRRRRRHDANDAGDVEMVPPPTPSTASSSSASSSSGSEDY